MTRGRFLKLWIALCGVLTLTLSMAMVAQQFPTSVFGRLLLRPRAGETALQVQGSGGANPAHVLRYQDSDSSKNVTIDPGQLSIGSNSGFTGSSCGAFVGGLCTSSGSGGGGTVTNTGTLTSGKTIVGNGGVDVSVSSLTATFVASASGVLSALTGTQATALLDAFVGDSGSGGTKGLVPAPASGDAAAGKFLKADGTFAVPSGGGGGGGLVLLEEHTASSSASLDFTTRNVTGQSGATFQSDYDDYEIRITSIVPASDAAFQLQVSTDGGSTWDTTSGHYTNSHFVWSSAGSALGGGSASAIHVYPYEGRNASASLPFSGTLRLTNPLSTSAKQTVMGKMIGGDSVTGNVTQTLDITGSYEQLAAFNAVRFIFPSVNIASGTIRVYGIAK